LTLSFFSFALCPALSSSTPPFDRHDWIVKRSNGQEVRYVIDYYSDTDYDENQSEGTSQDQGESDRDSSENSLTSKTKSVIETGNGLTKKVEKEEEDDDEASFNLDVRPALDGFGAAKMRFRRAFREWKDGEEQT